MHAHIPIGSGIHICGYLLRALHCVWLLLLFKVYQKFSLFSVTCFVRVVEADPQVIVSQQIVRIPSNPSTKTVRSVRVQSSTFHFFISFRYRSTSELINAMWISPSAWCCHVGRPRCCNLLELTPESHKTSCTFHGRLRPTLSEIQTFNKITKTFWHFDIFNHFS